MNKETLNHKSDQSDNFSSSSDEVFMTQQQIPQGENKFEDINEFWANTNATPRHTVSTGTPKDSPHIMPPIKSPLNKMLSFQQTPPRSFQKSINKPNNSPIYVGTSTEDTPYRLNSKESSSSTDSSSDDITFIDTPIQDRLKVQPPLIKDDGNNIFKLSPITSNKNESFKNIDISENDYSVDSSSESDIINIKNSYLNEGKLINEQNQAIISIHEDKEISNEVNDESDIPLPTFSISNSSDSEYNKDQENLEEANQISQTETINDQSLNKISNKRQKESKSKKRSVSKPAFASPKRISNGLKEETIITELSPFASSRRRKIESKNLQNFRLSRIDHEEEEEIKEKNNHLKNMTNIKNEIQDDHSKASREEYDRKNNLFYNDDQNKSNVSSDDDIKTIEKLAKKDPHHTKKMDDLITDYSLSKKKSVIGDENDEKGDDISRKKQNKSPSSKNLSKSKSKIDESEPKPKAESKSPKSKSPSKTQNRQKQNRKSKEEPKAIENPKVVSKEEEEEIEEKENDLKLQNQSKSKSKSKSRTTKQSNSQPPKTKSKPKSEPKSRSPSKSTSQPTKSRTKKSTKQRYDFNMFSDSDDDERISNLIQIPVQNNEKNTNGDSSVSINDDDLPIALRRRKRVIVKPLKFWCGEHIVYGLSEDGFQTFQNVSIPEKLRKLKKGEIRLLSKEQKRIPAKEDNDRKLVRVEGSGLVVFQRKVVDFDNSNEVVLKKGLKCNVTCKGDSPLIFKIEEI